MLKHLAWLACMVFVMPALASGQVLDTVTLEGVIGEQLGTHNIVITCTDTILVYDLDVFIPRSDSEDSYSIAANSVRVGGDALAHPLHVPRDGHMDFSLDSYPVAVPVYNPLVVPVQVLDTHDGAPARALVDMVYLAGEDTACSMAGLRGPQQVGMLADTGDTGADPIVAAALMAADDYNAYLAGIGEQWSLDIMVTDDDATIGGAAEGIRELAEGGISVILGPRHDAQLAAVSDYIRLNDMLAISCCSTSTALSSDDAIFRMVPDDANGVRALAGVMAEDGIRVAVLVHSSDSYGRGMGDILAEEMARHGGAVGATITYLPGTQEFGEVAVKAGSETDIMADANDPSQVALVAVSLDDAIGLIQSATINGIDDIPWYSLGTLSHPGLDLPDGLDAQLTVVAVTESSSPLADSLAQRLRNELSLADDSPLPVSAYAAYDSVLVLGGALMAVQDSDITALSAALPHAAAHSYGTLGYNTLNGNGDMASSNYGIWGILNGEWIRTGTYMQQTGTVAIYP